MIDAVTVLLSHFLAHPEHGAFEMANTLPRYTFAGADTPAPREFAIENDVEDENIAKNLDPVQTPCLVVWGDSSVNSNLAERNYRRAQDVVVAVAYVVDASDDPAVANHECGLAMRGIALSMHRYNDQKKAEGYRSLNGIEVKEVSTSEEQRVTAAVGSRRMVGFMSLHARAVETFS